MVQNQWQVANKQTKTAGLKKPRKTED